MQLQKTIVMTAVYNETGGTSAANIPCHALHDGFAFKLCQNSPTVVCGSWCPAFLIHKLASGEQEVTLECMPRQLRCPLDDPNMPPPSGMLSTSLNNGLTAKEE